MSGYFAHVNIRVCIPTFGGCSAFIRFSKNISKIDYSHNKSKTKLFAAFVLNLVQNLLKRNDVTIFVEEAKI
jgi:hypothetical protein